MLDDLKDIVVDWSQTTPQNGNSNTSLTTTCTESAKLLGIETAGKNLISSETFSKKDENK